MIFSLAEIKKHLNIDSSFNDDNDYLEMLDNAATLAVENYLNRDLTSITGYTYSYSTGNTLVKTTIYKLPAPIQKAILVQIANLYANRESISYASITEISKNFQFLLSAYKKYTV